MDYKGILRLMIEAYLGPDADIQHCRKNAYSTLIREYSFCGMKRIAQPVTKPNKTTTI